MKSFSSKRHCDQPTGARQSRSRKWIASSLTLLAMTMFVLNATAQEAVDEGTLERRLELAKQMQDIRPARKQVEAAIDQYVSGLPPADQAVYKTALRNALNYKALEKISVDAYAETYTEAELAAMVEYYSKPEARSASEKKRAIRNHSLPRNYPYARQGHDEGQNRWKLSLIINLLYDLKS